MSTFSLKQIDDGLARYYEEKECEYYNEDGIGKFSEWCEANGYDTDGMRDEFDLKATDCCLVDFDEHFPTTKTGNERSVEIFSILHNYASNAYYGLSQHFVLSVVKIFEKCGFSKANIVNTINALYNKSYEKYSIPEGEKLVIHSTKDIEKIICHLYETYFEQREPIKANVDFAADSVLTMRRKRLSTVISSFWRNVKISEKVMNAIIDFVAWEDANDFISAILPKKKKKKAHRMVVDDGNLHFFEELELRYFCPIHLNRKINSNISMNLWSQSLKDSNIIGGKSDILQLNVLKNVHIDSTNENVVGCIYNKEDIVLNVDGNLEVAAGAKIRSKNGNIVLNVRGDIYLHKGAKIITSNGNIFIRCNNMTMADHSYIETFEFGEKFKKINHITLNYALTAKNKEILYGDVYMNVKNKLTMGNGACRIKSGDVKIECGGIIDCGLLRCVLAFRNNVQMNCEKMKVAMHVLEKKIDARNQVLINSKSKINIKGFVNSKICNI